MSERRATSGGCFPSRCSIAKARSARRPQHNGELMSILNPQAASASHPRLQALINRAHELAAVHQAAIGLVHPCDAMALRSAACIRDAAIGRPVLIGHPELIERAAAAAEIDCRDFEIIPTAEQAPEAARQATSLARDGTLSALMKGSLHTDELMSAVVDRANGLRSDSRISHVFLFDLPRYHKLLALADCVVNITPNLKTKQDILGNTIGLLRCIGIEQPKVAIVAAVETVNPAIQATVDAQDLVRQGQAGTWLGAIVEGPLGFDNAFSMEAAQTKNIDSSCAGDFDFMLVPDLNAGNLLYKSFVYVGGGECAGLVLGARTPIVLTSRADSLMARLASVALAVVATQGDAPPKFNRSGRTE